MVGLKTILVKLFWVRDGNLQCLCLNPLQPSVPLNVSRIQTNLLPLSAGLF